MKKRYYSPAELISHADDIRERLTRFMQEEKLTMASAAKRIGVTRWVILNFIDNKKTPRTDYLYKIMEFFEELVRLDSK